MVRDIIRIHSDDYGPLCGACRAHRGTARLPACARFENLVACHLLKWVHFEQDTRGGDLDLSYVRDIDGCEVDFVVVEGRRLPLPVARKWSDAEPDRGLRGLKVRFAQADTLRLSASGTKDFLTPEGMRVAPA